MQRITAAILAVLVSVFILLGTQAAHAELKLTLAENWAVLFPDNSEDGVFLPSTTLVGVGWLEKLGDGYGWYTEARLAIPSLGLKPGPGMISGPSKKLGPVILGVVGVYQFLPSYEETDPESHLVGGAGAVTIPLGDAGSTIAFALGGTRVFTELPDGTRTRGNSLAALVKLSFTVWKP